MGARKPLAVIAGFEFSNSQNAEMPNLAAPTSPLVEQLENRNVLELLIKLRIGLLIRRTLFEKRLHGRSRRSVALQHKKRSEDFRIFLNLQKSLIKGKKRSSIV